MCTDEPDTASRNEPDMPPTANDDAPIPRYPGGFDLDDVPQNEPGIPPTANDDVPIPRYPGGFDLDEVPRNEPGSCPRLDIWGRPSDLLPPAGPDPAAMPSAAGRGTPM